MTGILFMDTQKLVKFSKLLRYFILTSTSKAGSGHPTSGMSATELMAVLFFDGFYKYDLTNPDNPKSHRLLFSKGHASPLFYALYAAAGAVSENELMTLRQSDSDLEGHPTTRFKYTEAPTGSLGQGLSIGLGMALAGAPRVYVLMGDGEFAEGNIYEALELAGYYKAHKLLGILDVNRLGQSDPTMLEWDLATYKKRVEAFGWKTFVLEDGHDMEAIRQAYTEAEQVKDQPQMIIAKTKKGKGVSFLEDKEGWHGKAVPPEQLEAALKEIGEVDRNLRGEIKHP